MTLNISAQKGLNLEDLRSKHPLFEKLRLCKLDRNIWHSSISLPTKLRLYRVFILPVILYGAETWSPTRQLARNLDAFDQWCLRRIRGISWRDRISNEEVRRRTDQPPLTDIIRTTRLISRVPIRPWTTFELSELVWPLCQGIEP